MDKIDSNVNQSKRTLAQLKKEDHESLDMSRKSITDLVYLSEQKNNLMI